MPSLQRVLDDDVKGSSVEGSLHSMRMVRIKRMKDLVVMCLLCSRMSQPGELLGSRACREVKVGFLF